MRAACPTPVSVMEEGPSPRSVGSYQTPVYVRTRVSKGFACRKPSLCLKPSLRDPGVREKPLSPSSNLQGTCILQRKSRPHARGLNPQATPRTPAPSARPGEISITVFRDNSECYDWGSSAESEWEGDDSMHPLSVTGRNPAASESNVVDYRDVRLPDVHLPRSTVQQSRNRNMSRRYNLTLLPTKTLNVGGLRLPFPTEPPCASGKDYKPGRVVNTSFDCFRCEHRMSAHDNHQWLKSILVSSRLRRTKKLPSYSKGDISWALFPRYWSNQYLSPEPVIQVKTPGTRPMTQTPDTISGPWRGDNSRSISIINGQLTREDLEGFRGCHGKGSCNSKMEKEQLTPCRAYKSDTQLGVNFMTYGDLWGHSADMKNEIARVNSQLSENGARETTSVTSQSDKISRLSVYSREGHARGRSSAFGITMRLHSNTPEDAYYELHHETNVDGRNYHEETDGMNVVQMDYSLTPIQKRGNWNHILGEEDECGQEEELENYPEDKDQRCFSFASTPSWCLSRSSVVSEGYQRAFPSDFYDVSASECYDSLGSDNYGASTKQGTFSQIDCNTSAVDRYSTLQGRGKKSQGQRKESVSPINFQYLQHNYDEDGFLPHHHWQHSVPGVHDNSSGESTGVGASLDDNRVLGVSDHQQEQQLDIEDEEEEDEEEDGEADDEDPDNMLQNPHSQFLLKMRQEMNSKHTEQPHPELSQPLGKYFCYAPIVDKRYNKWKRRKPKKRKRVAVKVHTYDGKTSTSTSNESTAVAEEEINGRELKKGKHYRRDGAKCRGRNNMQQSTDDTNPQEALDASAQLRSHPVVDRSDLTSAEETQLPDSTEAGTDSSKSSLTSRSSGSCGPEPRSKDSIIIPSPVTFVSIDDLCPSPTKEPSSPELEYRRQEPIIEQDRARSRVASIPSKNYPRTQKSLLSLSLRGPTFEKEMSTIDVMQALPRAGARLPLLKTQRERLARSSDIISRIPSNTSGLNKMQQRIGWIKRGILQQNSNADLKLSAEKCVISPPPKSPVPFPRVTRANSKHKSAIPRHTKASREEKFCTVVRGQKKHGSTEKKHANRRSLGHGVRREYSRESDAEEDPPFTLKDLLSTLPNYQSTTKRTHRKKSPHIQQLTNFFASNFVKGSFQHNRKLKRPNVDRSISVLSFTPAFTFSVYTLPRGYRSHNNHMDGATN